ncbi:MAG: low affinity iron permease family protein [Acidobacteriota bacterium]|nr:low affinity iron permease family protein [Acidobacteriota bacterium]MDE3043580.1 low affinity iron permease family protein [Acidobacteriota bacterium]MDE3107367.1 low affinity iron permease family protein [Acidobacteriota bacterium]MDE3222586.1 low affinity iron permease family protein [Acidobacteriota bacterium]
MSTVLVVVLILVGVNVVMAWRDFPDRWQIVYSTLTNTVVVVMLFALKHTDNRQQTALQLKLDELIRALPTADNHLVQIEQAPEEELGEREREQIAMHEALRTEDS